MLERETDPTYVTYCTDILSFITAGRLNKSVMSYQSFIIICRLTQMLLNILDLVI